MYNLFMGSPGGSTYCPNLWNEVFIDERGLVYACCCDAARPYGDIYKGRLKDICNSAEARRQRRQSLAGTLKCYEHCFILKKASLPPAPPGLPLKIDYYSLKRLKLRFGQLCNIRCIMCVQDHRRGPCLDLEAIRRNVDLAPFASLEMEGGEPLFMKDSRGFFDLAASLGKRVSFLSNGTLIDEEWAEKIARHSAYIYVSLNGATKATHELVNAGSKWENVLRNIRRVRRWRRRLGSDVVIRGHMTLVRENLDEVPLFIRTFKGLGVDRICFCHAESSVKAFHEEPAEAVAFKRAVEAAYAASPHKKDINLAGLLPLLRAVLPRWRAGRRH